MLPSSQIARYSWGGLRKLKTPNCSRVCNPRSWIDRTNRLCSWNSEVVLGMGIPTLGHYQLDWTRFLDDVAKHSHSIVI